MADAVLPHLCLPSGKWNSHVDAVRCTPDGQPAADAESKRLWSIAAKPEEDYYGFTNFAHKLNSCEGILEPLPSDSRRRSDRAALSAGEMTQAGGLLLLNLLRPGALVKRYRAGDASGSELGAPELELLQVLSCSDQPSTWHPLPPDS